MTAPLVRRYGDRVHRFLLLHGGNPLDELLIAAAGAVFLIGGWIAIRMAPRGESPESPSADEEDVDSKPTDEQEWRPRADRLACRSARPTTHIDRCLVTARANLDLCRGSFDAVPPSDPAGADAA